MLSAEGKRILCGYIQRAAGVTHIHTHAQPLDAAQRVASHLSTADRASAQRLRHAACTLSCSAVHLASSN